MALWLQNGFHASGKCSVIWIAGWVLMFSTQFLRGANRSSPRDFLIRRALGYGFQLRMKKEMRRLVTRHEERPEQSVAIFKMTKIDRLLRAVFADAP